MDKFLSVSVISDIDKGNEAYYTVHIGGLLKVDSMIYELGYIKYGITCLDMLINYPSQEVGLSYAFRTIHF